MTLKPPALAIGHRHTSVHVIDVPRGWPRLELRGLWTYRELAGFLVWRDFKVRYKQTLIGGAWAVVQPLVTVAIFTLVFGRFAHLPTEGLPQPVFYYSGLLAWTYFATAFVGITNAVAEERQLLTKVYFPRLLLPLAAVIRPMIDYIVGLGLLAVLMLVFNVAPAPTILLLPAFFAILVLAALGTGVWLAALNAMYRDVRFLAPFLIQALLFLTPVAYPSSLVPDSWRDLYRMDPLAVGIEGARWAVTGHGSAPSGVAIVVASSLVLAVLWSGLVFFRRIEHLFVDVV